MNKEEANKTTNNKKFLEEQSCWITIHLGIKPVKGGRPPIERSLVNIISFKTGLALIWLTKWLKWKVCIK